MTASDNILPNVRRLKPYTLKRRNAHIKLNQNESPLDLPTTLKRAIADQVVSMPWNRYPDFHPQDVLEALGAPFDLGPEAVLIGNGSNELLQAVFQATVGPGQSVTLPAPTFTLYRTMVEANGGTVDLAYLKPDMTYDLDALMRRAHTRDRHIVICAPNNPTGTWLDPAFVSRLCRTTSKLVIVDEAYIEFVRQEGGSCAERVREHNNLIVLRTFSKALGLAGVRFGYALGAPELIEHIRKIKLPYNVGHFGLETIRHTLKAPDYVARLTAQIVAERVRIAEALKATGVEVFPTESNFILFRTPHAATLWEGLAQRNILIRDVSHYPKLANCLRVTVGAQLENDAFLKATRKILARCMSQRA